MHLKYEISWYFIGKVLSFISPLLLIPILTHTLSTEDYGIVGTYTSLYQGLNIFINMSVAGAIVRAYMDKDLKNFNFSSYLFNGFVVNLLFFIATLIPLFLLEKFNFIDLPEIIFILVPFIIILSTFKSYKHKLWNIQKEALKYNAFEIVFGFSLMILTSSCVYSLFPDWRGRIYAITLTELFFCITSLFFLFKEEVVVFKFNKQYFIDIIKYGIPLLPHALGLLLIVSADKLLINKIYGLSNVGIYSVAIALSGLLSIFTIPFEQALTPYVYENLKNRTNIGNVKYVVSFYIFILLCVVASLLLYVLLPIIIPFFIGEPFFPALEFLSILLIGQIFHALYRYIIKPIFYSKKTYLVAICTLTSGLLGLAFQIILVNYYGMVGIATGTTLAHLLSFVFAFYYSNRLFSMPWRNHVEHVKYIKSVFIKK